MCFLGEVLQVLHQGKRLRVPVVQHTFGRTIGHWLEVPVSTEGRIVRLRVFVSVARSECFIFVAGYSLVVNVIVIHHLFYFLYIRN